jgi:RNA polymerase sigma-70 factor (ECF subfamily)
MDDRDIIKNILDGKKDDFGLLVKKYFDGVRRVCLSLCGNGFDADDATQEAFVDAFVYLPSLSDHDKFAPWLYKIARRKCFRRLSSRRTDEDIDDMAELLPSNDSSPLDAAIQKEQNLRVYAALSRLSEKRRAVAEMFYFRGMKVSDIAARLDLSENTVKSRLYDAREQLRKELYDMNEYKDNITILKDKIEKRIKALSRYWTIHGRYDDKFYTDVGEMITLINSIEDEKTRQNYLSQTMYMPHWGKGEDVSDLEEKQLKAAEEGGNAEVFAAHFFKKMNALRNEEQRLAVLDGEALPKIEQFKGEPSYKNAKGEILFWKGATLLRLDREDEADKAFAEAAELLDKEKAYHANAVAALREIAELKEHAYAGGTKYGFDAGAEGLIFDGTRLLFHNQPGFSNDSFMGMSNRFSSFIFFASTANDVLFDTSMKPGDKITGSNKYQIQKTESTLECVGYDENVEISIGKFTDCMHFKTSGELRYDGEFTLDMFYAKNVGLVKAEAKYGEKIETYELTEYSIVGGDGYFPCAVGNRWVYKNPDQPEWSYQHIERTVEYFDGELVNFAVSTPAALSKDFENATDLDSSVYLSFADVLCSDWKIEEAIDMLKRGVRLNINEESVRISLYAIESLERLMEYRKYGKSRLCPSSINASTVSVSESRVKFDDQYVVSSLGPYRFGKRGRYEDRIFGIKPFRYLDHFMKTLWDDKWTVGYREERDTDDGKFIFTVDDGGTVTVPSGTFENCRKITLRVDKPDGEDDKWFYGDGYKRMHCGAKEYFFAPGVGIVKIKSTWGEAIYAECDLVSYSVPAATKDEFLPVHIGNRWEYDEPHLTSEGYRARAIFSVPSGMNGKYLMTSSQEFIYLDSEEKYEEFVKESHKY